MFISRHSLGIDFRNDKLRLAYLAFTGGQVQLLSYANLSLPPLREGNLTEYEVAFVETLRNFINTNKVKTENILVALPQADVIFRRLEIPAVKTENIRQILEFEIERHVPFPLKDVYFDFQIIEQKPNNKIELSLIATKKERVDYLLSLLGMAEVKYTGVELTTQALFACLNFQKKQPDNYLIVEIDYNEVEIGIIQKGNFVFSHSTAKETLLTTSNLTEEESKGLAANLSQEITFLTTSLQKNYDGFNIESIFLGGVNVSASLAEYLQEMTQIETNLWNPLDGITTSSNFKEGAAECAAAIGLALKGLEVANKGYNLLPTEELQALQKNDSFVLPVVLGAIIVILALASGTSHIFKERNQLKEIEERLVTLQPQVAAVEKASKHYQRLKKQMQNLQSITQQPVSLLEVLKELTLKLPSDVWLERFYITTKEVQLGGYADVASNIIPILEASPLFRDVKFTSTITSRGGGKERFKLKITLEHL